MEMVESAPIVVRISVVGPVHVPTICAALGNVATGLGVAEGDVEVVAVGAEGGAGWVELVVLSGSAVPPTMISTLAERLELTRLVAIT